MILAAGRGERMRPLTDTCPKPLLAVRGKPLMQYHMEALVRAGFRELVVNTGWLGDQIEQRFGSEHAAACIHYSHEGRDFGGPIETAGGIARALPMLDECFWIVAGDVFVPGFEFGREKFERFAAGDALAHLVLVPNPAHNPKGDFGLEGERVVNEAAQRHTYSTIGLYRRTLFTALPAGNPQGVKAPLAPLLRTAIAQGRVSGELYTGEWTDVGTPERLAALNAGG